MSWLEEFASTTAGRVSYIEPPQGEGNTWKLLKERDSCDRRSMQLMQLVLLQVTDQPPRYLMAFRTEATSSYSRGVRAYCPPRTSVFSVNLADVVEDSKLIRVTEVLDYSNERKKTDSKWKKTEPSNTELDLIAGCEAITG